MVFVVGLASCGALEGKDDEEVRVGRFGTVRTFRQGGLGLGFTYSEGLETWAEPSPEAEARAHNPKPLNPNLNPKP